MACTKINCPIQYHNMPPDCDLEFCPYRTEDAAITKPIKLEISRNPRNIVWKCGHCGQYMHKTSWGAPVNYCTCCGYRLEWEEDGM